MDNGLLLTKLDEKLFGCNLLVTLTSSSCRGLVAFSHLLIYFSMGAYSPH
jgi:hypothetical protein